MSDWTVAKIKAKIRELTGRPSTVQMTEDDLLDHINDYYSNILPNEISYDQLIDWYELLTSDIDTGAYGFEESMKAIFPPVYCDDVEMTLYTDYSLFRKAFKGFERGTPQGALIEGRTLYVLPQPEGGHIIKLRAAHKLTRFVNDSDTPLNQDWGLLIAYGTSILILQEIADKDGIESLTPLYKYYLNLLKKDEHQQLSQTRPIPRW